MTTSNAPISPQVIGRHGTAEAASSRLSPDGKSVAFFVPEANPPALFVGKVEDAENIGMFSQRVVSLEEKAYLADVEWSPDGEFIGFTITSGPPPGEVRIGIVHVGRKDLKELPGMAFTWAGREATLLIVDPANKRLYLHDAQLGVEHTIGEIEDDGDPHFAPAISVSPKQDRFALVTRSVAEGRMRVHLAHHEGAVWRLSHLTDMPSTAARILPFWSADGTACALYIVDLEQHHSAIIAVPDRDGQGDVLYTSDTIDAPVAPAAHPGGRLIALVRAHPRENAQTLSEYRLVMLDPAEQAVTPIAEPGVVGRLRFLDETTLLVEGRSIWTIKLKTTEEAVKEEAKPQAANQVKFVKTTVQHPKGEWSFSVDVPEGWQRLALPAQSVDFNNPTDLEPLALFTPNYAAIVFTAAARPILPGATAMAMLQFLAAQQGFSISGVRHVALANGKAADALATQTVNEDVMHMRLVVLEDGGTIYALSTMAPAPLWEAMKPTLDRMVESFVLVEAKGQTTPVFE